MRLSIILCLSFIISLITGFVNKAIAQASPYQGNERVYHYIDRLDIENKLPYLHTGNKDYAGRQLKELPVDSVGTATDYGQDYLQKQFFPSQEDSQLSRKLYKIPAALFSLDIPDFSLRVSPIIHFQLGRETNSGETIFLNKRGLELYGVLDEKLYFYSSLQENQSNFFNYLNASIAHTSAIPGNGFYKSYNSRISNLEGFDYALGEAFIGFKTSKHTIVELGHKKHFIGHGMRSLLLGNSGNNYFYLKFDIKIWKFHYQTILAELAAVSSNTELNNILLPKKYITAHYLSYKPRHNMEIGLFEAVVYARENHFEFQYLNPVILYRTVEHSLDSPDNVLIGLNGKWNLFKKLSLYGQVVLDELKVDELFSDSGWWANKYGIQTGIKYIDVAGISFLDFQLEYNRVRPFTYSHWNTSSRFPEVSVANYSHFSQPLAHPLGANFSEVIFKLRYQPTRKIVIDARYLYTIVGRNDILNNINYGSDVLIPNGTRFSNYGVSQHVGVKSTIKLIDVNIGYELYHNLFIDLSWLSRSDSHIIENINTNYIGGSLRYNIGRTLNDY